MKEAGHTYGNKEWGEESLLELFTEEISKSIKPYRDTKNLPKRLVEIVRFWVANKIMKDVE